MSKAPSSAAYTAAVIIVCVAVYIALGRGENPATNDTSANPTATASATATVDPIIVPAPKMPEKKPFQYEPETLLPLAVGNIWIYQWSSPAITEGEEVKAAKSIFYAWMSYDYNKRSVMAVGYHPDAKLHEETYEVVRVDGDHYFFTATANPDVGLRFIRDGRYDNSAELCWTWWDKREQHGGSVGLTESIKRDWTIHADYLLDGAPLPADEFDLPADHRDVLRVEFEYGTWGDSFTEIWEVGREFRFKTQPSHLESIEVPAGTFTDCLESIEKFSGKVGTDELKEWETHIFWAPGVGKVYEYQVFPDGKITYELKLVSYKLN